MESFWAGSRRLARFFFSWISLLALWLILVSSSSEPEVLAGMAAAAIGALATAVVELRGQTRFRPHLRSLLLAWRIPGAVLVGTVRTLQALSLNLILRKKLPSAVLAVDYDAVEDDPESSARRALAVTYSTVSPNVIILGVVRKQKLLLYHQLMPGKVDPILLKLGARP